jgi:hypothetical protein
MWMNVTRECMYWRACSWRICLCKCYMRTFVWELLVWDFLMWMNVTRECMYWRACSLRNCLCKCWVYICGSFELEELFMWMLHENLCVEASSQRNCFCKCYTSIYLWKLRVRKIVYVNVTREYICGHFVLEKLFMLTNVTRELMCVGAFS